MHYVESKTIKLMESKTVAVKWAWVGKNRKVLLKWDSVSVRIRWTMSAELLYIIATIVTNTV